MHRFVFVARRVLFVGALVTAIILSVVVGVAGDGGQSGPALAAAILFTVAILMVRPSTRPVTKDTVSRSPASIAVGRSLVWLTWITYAGTIGLGAYLFIAQTDRSGFQVRLAALTAVYWVLGVLMRKGRQLVGFPVDRLFPRGWRLVRAALNLALWVVVAGFSYICSGLAWAVASWGPAQVFHALDGVTWLAVLITVIVVPLWVAVLLAAMEVVGFITERILGPGNVVNAWLDDHKPIKFNRSTTYPHPGTHPADDTAFTPNW